MKYAWGALVVVIIGLCGCGKGSDSKVVFTTKDGQEVSDLKKVEGEASYKVLGTGTIPEKAKELHEVGRKYGGAGKYDAALMSFDEASKLAPGWAYPIYDTAFTLLLKGDSTNALAKYREVDRMETNGFFTTKTAIWTLEREESGKLPKGTYLAYVSLESVDEKEKQARVEKLATNLPTYPPIWKEKVFAAKTTPEKLEFIDKALALGPDPETYGILMINRAAVLHQQNKRAEAKAILTGLTTETNTVSTRELARQVLKALQ